jgi:hypothetical protein
MPDERRAAEMEQQDGARLSTTFNLQRHLISRSTLRIFRAEATAEWQDARVARCRRSGMTLGEPWLSMRARRVAVTKPRSVEGEHFGLFDVPGLFPMRAGGAATVNCPVRPSPLRCGSCGGSCCGRGHPKAGENRGGCVVAAGGGIILVWIVIARMGCGARAACCNPAPLSSRPASNPSLGCRRGRPGAVSFSYSAR